MQSKEQDRLSKECWIKLHSTVTVWTKWQVVIPSDIRELLWIKPWDTLMVVTKHSKAIWMIKTDDVELLMEYIKNEQANNN